MERPIRYVRENFIYAREFLNDADLSEQLSRWIQKANGRLHGTTKEVPTERFLKAERHVLLPVAPRPYHSLLLHPERAAPAEPKLGAVPKIAVERRSLVRYSEHASTMAGAA